MFQKTYIEKSDIGLLNIDVELPNKIISIHH